MIFSVFNLLSGPTMYELYMLEGRLPTKVKAQAQWMRWFQSADRTVALTRLGPVIISTQFTGVSTLARPKLFETLVSLHDYSDYCWRRYHSWNEALRGHDELVSALNQAFCKPEDIIDYARVLIGPDPDALPPVRNWQNRRTSNGTRALIHDGVKLN